MSLSQSIVTRSRDSDIQSGLADRPCLCDICLVTSSWWQLLCAMVCSAYGHSWPRASSLRCLSKGRTQLFSNSQSVYGPLSNSVTRAHGCVCLCKGQPCRTAAGCKHTFLRLSDVQALLPPKMASPPLPISNWHNQFTANETPSRVEWAWWSSSLLSGRHSWRGMIYLMLRGLHADGCV